MCMPSGVGGRMLAIRLLWGAGAGGVLTLANMASELVRQGRAEWTKDIRYRVRCYGQGLHAELH